MRSRLIAPLLSLLVALLALGCVSSPGPSSAAPVGTSLPGVVQPTDAQEHLLDVRLLEVAEIKRSWGKDWLVNPFLPWEKSFSGKQFQIFAIEIKSRKNLALVLRPPVAYLPDGSMDGWTYDQQGFIDFWLDRTNEEIGGWDKKRTTIERTVKYFDSELPLYTGKAIVVPVVVPIKSPVPAKITMEVVVNGKVQSFELKP